MDRQRLECELLEHALELTGGNQRVDFTGTARGSRRRRRQAASIAARFELTTRCAAGRTELTARVLEAPIRESVLELGATIGICSRSCGMRRSTVLFEKARGSTDDAPDMADALRGKPAVRQVPDSMATSMPSSTMDTIRSAKVARIVIPGSRARNSTSRGVTTRSPKRTDAVIESVPRACDWPVAAAPAGLEVREDSTAIAEETVAGLGHAHAAGGAMQELSSRVASRGQRPRG